MPNLTIIAELGINHHGDLDIAKMMIDKASECGATMAKFQCYEPISVLGKNSPYLAEATKAQFTKDQHRQLKKYCDGREIEYGCSVFHFGDVDFFEDIGLKRYKIASRSAGDKALLRRIEKTKKPVIMSTGMCSMDDIGFAKALLGDRLALLYCVSKYPTMLKDINLEAMTLLSAYGEFGFSSHCPSITPSIAAVYRGATILENHVILQGQEIGCDTSSSISFRSFEKMVELAREAACLCA